MVQIKKTWETVHFTAFKGDCEVSLELTINHHTMKYNMVTDHEENVDISGETAIEAKLMLSVIKEAVKYINNNLYTKP